ncbi:MAG: guanitoxin biosynthesis heme-dependent pre-guanitoxin N-hydroxylase GntA [Ferruginibacter sp.]
MDHQHNIIIKSFHSFLTSNTFPCVAAKDAVAKDNILIMTASHLACPADDKAILDFIYTFTQAYRKAGKGFHSAAIIFKEPGNINEIMFDTFMWQRLKALREIDKKNYNHDSRVADDPASPAYSFSLMEEAFFIVALHPGNSRPARRFKYPTLVFNPHAQFEEMKKSTGYEKMKTIVRRRDMAMSGSVNPMLTDFGEASEVYQYSGQVYDEKWECPLNKNH